jgi:hypothetical protein
MSCLVNSFSSIISSRFAEETDTRTHGSFGARIGSAV